MTGPHPLVFQPLVAGRVRDFLELLWEFGGLGWPDTPDEVRRAVEWLLTGMRVLGVDPALLAHLEQIAEHEAFVQVVATLAAWWQSSKAVGSRQ